MPKAPPPGATWLSRSQAVAWFAAQGLTVTLNNLEKHAAAGTGPDYSRLGKRAYYKPEDLVTWLTASLKPQGDKQKG